MKVYVIIYISINKMCEVVVKMCEVVAKMCEVVVKMCEVVAKMCEVVAKMCRGRAALLCSALHGSSEIPPVNSFGKSSSAHSRGWCVPQSWL